MNEQWNQFSPCERFFSRMRFCHSNVTLPSALASNCTLALEGRDEVSFMGAARGAGGRGACGD